MSWIAAILSILGYIGVIYKKPFGLYLWTISNAMLVYITLKIPDYGLMSLYVIYSILNLAAIYKWKSNG